jgi:ferredoxin
MPRVKFYKEKREIEVPEGANLRQAALAAGIEIYPGINKLINCLGHGTCGSCRVLLLNGTVKNTSPQTLIERIRFATSFLNIGEEEEMRLSCQTRVLGDLEVFTQPAFNWHGKPDKQPIPSPY